MRRLKMFGLAVIVLVAVVCAIGAAVLNLWPSFGGSLQGDRAARAHASPQFRGGHFENVVPKTPMTNAVMVDLLKRQFSGNEMRTPPPPCPPVVRLAQEDFKGRPAAGLARHLVRARQRLSGNRRRPRDDRSDAVRLCLAVRGHRAEAVPSAAAGARSAAEDRRRGHLA